MLKTQLSMTSLKNEVKSPTAAARNLGQNNKSRGLVDSNSMNQSVFERNYLNLNDEEPSMTKNGAANYCDAVSFSKVHED